MNELSPSRLMPFLPWSPPPATASVRFLEFFTASIRDPAHAARPASTMIPVPPQSSNLSPDRSPRQDRPESQGAAVPHNRPAHPAPPAAGQRLSDNGPARTCCKCPDEL